MYPKLGPEVGFICERGERAGQAVIRLLQGHYTETSDVIRSFKLVCRTSPKRSSSYAHFTQFFDHMAEDIFDRPHWGIREFQSPLDLEAMCGSKLSKDNQRANLQQGEVRSSVRFERLTHCAIGIPRVEVLSMFRIIEWSQPCQMNLGSLPVRLPVRQAFVNQFLGILVNRAIDLDNLHTRPLRAMNLPPHGFVAFLRFDLSGIKPLLYDSTDGAPPQLVPQDALARFTHTRPDGLEFLLILNVMKERSDHL